MTQHNASHLSAEQAEQLSAWLDDSLEPHQSQTLAKAVLTETLLNERWKDWNLIGDVMRSASLARPTRLSDQVAERLTREPIHMQPAANRVSHAAARLRRHRVAYGVAAAAAVAFVSVVALAPQMQQTIAPVLMAGSTPAAPATPTQLDDPRLRELLDTHGSMAFRPVSAEVR